METEVNRQLIRVSRDVTYRSRYVRVKRASAALRASDQAAAFNNGDLGDRGQPCEECDQDCSGRERAAVELS